MPSQIEHTSASGSATSFLVLATTLSVVVLLPQNWLPLPGGLKTMISVIIKQLTTRSKGPNIQTHTCPEELNSPHGSETYIVQAKHIRLDKADSSVLMILRKFLTYLAIQFYAIFDK